MLITRLFQVIVDRPRLFVGLCVAAILLAIPILPQLAKDTRSDAFLAKDNPALVYRDIIKEQFGLSDPIIVAIQNSGPQGIFNPETLGLVQWLSDEIAELPNVDAARLLSLATEKNISSSADGIDIQPFFEPFPTDQSQADALRDAVSAFPLYMGSMVAKDHSVTLIVVELIDEYEQEASYQQLMALVNAAPIPSGTQVHVAGEGALAGYLGHYIETDAKKLNPLAWLIICLIIFIAYRRLNPVLMANVIIAASVLITLGIMAACEVPFFMITSALPVILIGISVADSIHIYSHYYDLQVKYPEMDVKDLTIATMMDMWRPVTLTTLTTIAGFLGLYFAAYMPPFKYFGLFAALGVLIAWFYSMVFLPAAIVLTKPQASGRLSRDVAGQASGSFGRVIEMLGVISLRYPKAILIGCLLICSFGVYAALHLTVDENPINIFHPDEPLYIADKVINENMDGSNALDIVIETNHAEGLFEPGNLQKMEALQAYAGTLPRVGGSTSIVDYLKQMNRAMNSGETHDYKLPDSKELVAQYFLVYSAMGDPTDFEEEIDYDYQTANIRIYLNSGYYSDFKPVVEELQRYIDDEFNNEHIKATLSGRVTLNYHWIKELGRSHFSGSLLALIMVGCISALLFRSAIGGVYALIPVAISVLLVYTAMVTFGLTVGVGTSMFAAVAIGLGVDFSIHTLDRLRSLHKHYGTDTDTIYREFYLTTGQTLLINFLALTCGFGVLISSQVASLNQFGAMLVVAVSTSFITSLTVLPALVKVFKPAFIGITKPGGVGISSSAAIPLICCIIFAASVISSPHVQAQSVLNLTAESIISSVNAVEDGEFVTQKLAMHTTDRHGKQRSRETINYRKYFDRDKKTVLFFLEPSNVRDTAFLIWNYADPNEEDDQWLYLPALRKVRRVSSANRGDYFLGTDFTYEDMKLDGKFEPRDYTFVLNGEESLEGVLTYKLEGTPRSEDIARELGYSKTMSWVNPANWTLVKAEFLDLKGNLLKTLTAQDIRQIDGYWTRQQLTMQNHQTGHKTEFIFSQVDYVTTVKNNLFSKQALARGH